jgi:hypothetical protein
MSSVRGKNVGQKLGTPPWTFGGFFLNERYFFFDVLSGG